MITPAPGHHVRDHPPGHEPRPLQIDVEHRIPGVLGQLVCPSIGTDTGVIEENVDPPEPLVRGRDGSRDCRVVTHVGGERQALDAERAASFLKRVEVGTGPQPIAGILECTRDVERDDMRAFARQRQRRGTPLAVRCSCHQGHLSRELGRSRNGLAHGLCSPAVPVFR